jgi:hypothetical protein
VKSLYCSVTNRAGNEKPNKVRRPLVTLHTTRDIPTEAAATASHKHCNDLCVGLKTAADCRSPLYTTESVAVTPVNPHNDWSWGSILLDFMFNYVYFPPYRQLSSQIERQIMLRPTVSRPVCPGRPPFGTIDQHFFHFNGNVFRQLWVCYYAAASLTNRRVCDIQLLLSLAGVDFLGSESSGSHEPILLSKSWHLSNFEDRIPSCTSPRNCVSQLQPRVLGSLCSRKYSPSFLIQRGQHRNNVPRNSSLIRYVFAAAVMFGPTHSLQR